MKINRKYGKVTDGAITYAPYTLTGEDGRVTISPTAEMYAAAGYLPVEDTPPSPPEGMTVSGRKWATDGVRCFEEYTYSPVVDEPHVHRYSKLKLYAALSAAGLWDRLTAYLDGVTVEGMNARVAFDLANELNDAHPMFASMLAQVQTALGVSDGQVAAILAEAEVDE